MAALLTTRIENDTKDFYRKANRLFGFSNDEITKKTDELKIQMVGQVAQAFAHVEKLNYMQMKSAMRFSHLQDNLQRLSDQYAFEISKMWGVQRKNFDLLARAYGGFVARKVTPPWIKTTLNLKAPVKPSDNYDARNGYINAYLTGIANQVVAQVRQAALNEETFSELIARIRDVLKISNRTHQEANRKGSFSIEPDDDTTLQSTYFDAGVETHTGVYSMDDYNGFIKDLRASNQWSYRARGATKAEGRQNEYLRKLEQVLSYDAASQLHDGLLQIGSQEMGIEDMEWVTSGPNVCDYCRDRDGLTLAEIAEKLNDDYGDDPPPLHPNCNCQLIPRIKTDWAKEDVESEGYTWDAETGVVYMADDQEKDAGFSDMTFDQYLKQIGEK